MQVTRKTSAQFTCMLVSKMGHTHEILQNTRTLAQFTPSHVRSCREKTFTASDLKSAATMSPELLNASPIQWESFCGVLTNNGFSSQDCLNMVTLYPKLVFTNSDRIAEALAYWRNTQIGDSNLLSLLKYHPQFLTIEPKQIESRIPLLRSLATNKRLTLLLKRCPDVMFQNWKDIQNRMNYLKDVMKIEDNEIMKTAALSLPLSDLITRHMFLERCGYAISVKPSNEEVNNYPKLAHITDTSDKRFATKIVGLTLEEYEVFQELYKVEMEKEKIEENSDSDTEQ